MYSTNSYSGSAFMAYFIRKNAQRKIRNYKAMRNCVSKVASGEMAESAFVQFAAVRFLHGFVRDGLAAVGLCYLFSFPIWYVAIYVLVRLAMFAGSIGRMFLDELVCK